MKSLLILDDDINLRRSLEKQMKSYGYEVFSCGSISEIPNREFQYALVDMRLDGEFGLSAIHIVKKRSPTCRLVVLTAYGSVANTVECMKAGAADYLLKPIGSMRIHEVLSNFTHTSENGLSDQKEMTLDQKEHEYIDYILTRNKGNITKTAKELGLHRQSLQRKLKKFNHKN